jgi:hypothetical protein
MTKEQYILEITNLLPQCDDKPMLDIILQLLTKNLQSVEQLPDTA